MVPIAPGDSDMPQPLSRVFPEANVLGLGDMPDSALCERPQLAHMIAQVIVSWSHVEGFMLKLFVTLMGGRNQIAADVFLALETQSAKIAAINAAAKRLPENQEQLLHAILRIAKSKQRARDKIAHGSWGFSPQLPDALLLIDPRASFAESNHKHDHIYVYRQSDFEGIIRDNAKVAGFVSNLHWIITGHVANRDGRLRDELLAEPEIRERLDRQASQD
jgi:hypothetical protein